LNAEKARHDFELAVATVQKNYVDEASLSVLVDDAVEAMYLYAGVAPLPDADAAPDDPLSRFSRVYEYLLDHSAKPLVRSEVWPQHNEQAATDQVDIGVLLFKSGEWIRITTVIPGSAAEAAGMNRGDAIIAINGRPTAGMSVSWCYQQLSGAEGTVVEVSVNTEEGEVVDYRIVRTPLRTPHIVMLMLPWRT
jgi:C-terminal processing protease CtpA/Prc